ncbi:MAG: hypothetical protein IJD00_03410 [Clostridia bacterium]|nr:hypothetical protein [Clostridia bacterium]
MKKTNKITLCALMAALAVVMMLLAYFPYLTYAIPAFAGLCIMVVLLEIGTKWAILAYITSAVLTLLFCEPEAMLMYVFLFGYYPILKALIEKINKPLLEWPIKMLIFNVVVIFVYSVIAKLFGVDFSNDFSLGKYTAYIVLAVGNVVFVIYDITVAKMSTFYFYIIKPKLRKFFK